MSNEAPQYDVITLGETMARFTPPGFERFGQSRSVEMHVGGSESNTAVGLARLGHRVCWLSRMTDNAIGRWIATEIASQGVDVSRVIWTDEQRVGTYYMERGRPPRTSQVFYDRAGSAMSCMRPDELPLELFSKNSAKVFHTTGITVGLSQESRRTALHAVELARAAELKISFDLNFRSRLWSAGDAYAACEPIMAQADVVFLPVRDAQAVCRVAGSDPAAICGELHSRWPRATLVVTRGAQGAVAMDADGEFYEQPAFPAEEVERLGGGDAFSAGYLAALLSASTVADSLRWGCATAAIKYTIPGDLPLLDRDMVVTLVNDPSRGSANISR